MVWASCKRATAVHSWWMRVRERIFILSIALGSFNLTIELEAALGRPDVHLGAPSALFTAAGRTNARGRSVFYGANNRKAAIAEARPPVGSQIALAQFEIIRKLRLLDLTALSDIRVTQNLSDFGLAGRMEGAVFLRLLSERIMRPMMPDDDPFECLATQALADFLATEAPVPIDGIIFPSLQTGGDDLYVVLFYKAARLEALNVPEGTEISASTGYWREDGWVEDYEVVHTIAPLHKEVHKNEQESKSLDFTAIAEAMPLDPREVDWREISLRIVHDSMEVHRVKHTEFATDRFTVKRHRREKRDSIDV